MSEGIETIDEYAFNECWNISELYFPSSLTDIESNAFDALPNLITLDITDVGNWA
ncbi:MAG: leucine-rich repeat protein, partial [Prevotella sp.]|nr:leucine-rich repeat protein [Prevotella sp.]